MIHSSQLSTGQIGSYSSLVVDNQVWRHTIMYKLCVTTLRLNIMDIV